MSIKNLAGRASEVDLLFHLMKLGSNPFSNFCASFVVGFLYLTWTNGTTPNCWFIGIYHWYQYLTKLTCLRVMHTSYICFQCGVWCVCGRINSQHASFAAAFEQVSLSLSCWWKLPAGSHSMTSLCCIMRSFSKNIVLEYPESIEGLQMNGKYFAKSHNTRSRRGAA